MIVKFIATVLALIISTYVFWKGFIRPRYIQFIARMIYIAAHHTWPWRQHPGFDIATFQSDSPPLQYKYEPLANSRQIRLLKVWYGDSPEKRVCELIPVSLDNLPTKYIAFSYSWGDPTITSTLLFTNKRSLSLRKSVHNILDTIFGKRRTIYIWIDSICINQNDADEKSIQIRLMNEIYQKAYQVVLSLGEATPASDLGMDFVYQLYAALYGVFHGGGDRAVVDPKIILQKMCIKTLSPSLVAFLQLLSRPWFTRIWVVQEVAMASNPIFVCGNRAVVWPVFSEIAIAIVDHSLASLFMTDTEDTYIDDALISSAFGSLHSLVRMTRARNMKQGKAEEPIQDNLIRFHHFDATDSRDKIFALLGLAADADDVMLNPNYKASVDVVYANVARYLLLRNDSIVILHKAGIGNQRIYNNLPSWVPEWHTHPQDEPTSLGTIYKQFQFKAAGDTVPNITSSNDKVLNIDGVIIDTVRSISSTVRFEILLPSPRGKEKEMKAHISSWLEEVEHLIAALHHDRNHTSTLRYPWKNCSWAEALWRTLVLNAPAPAELEDCYHLWRQVMTPEAPGSGVTNFDSPKQKINIFDSIFTTTTKNRKFFTTDRGYIGLTSRGTLPGDKVCIFLGGHSPFIIRQAASSSTEDSCSWNLVGEAYVHGLMDGEGLEMGDVESIRLI
jgi:hypothetical protein